LRRAGIVNGGFAGTGGIDSLTQYARSLRTSDIAPGNPMDRFTIAERQFNAVAGAAASGDAASIASFQGYANEYLSASRAVYGSGAGFADAFSRVTSFIERIGEQQANDLTASVYNAGNAALSASIVAAIERLQEEVVVVRGSRLRLRLRLRHRQRRPQLWVRSFVHRP
jgi:tRNA A37 threonylcarbamoyltransferase TsaD